jgi:hypothetical protein
MSHYDEEMIKVNAEHSVAKKEMVNSPKHYNNHPSGIECKVIIEHFSYHLGCAMKYIWRCDDKFNAIEDLQKAINSIQSEIDMRLRK